LSKFSPLLNIILTKERTASKTIIQIKSNITSISFNSKRKTENKPTTTVNKTITTVINTFLTIEIPLSKSASLG
jgi:hypothetical protein